MVVLLPRQSSYDVSLMEASKLTLLRSLASELVYEYLDDIDIHGGIYTKPVLISLIKRLISLFFTLNNYKHNKSSCPKFTVTEPPIGYPLIFPHVTQRMRFCVTPQPFDLALGYMSQLICPMTSVWIYLTRSP